MAKIKKFALWLSHELIIESKAALLNKDIYISKLVVYMKKVVEEKKKQAEMSER